MTSSVTVLGPAELRRRYEDGERDFHGVTVDAAKGGAESLRDATLDGANFSGAFIVADFSNASLRGCSFVRANVKTCCFDGADLRGSDFTEAAIDAATFRSAQLERAVFVGASAYGHTFEPDERPDFTDR